MFRFVILAAPRTGSNLLCTLLNSHPEILCHHEVFNPAGIFTALTHRDTDVDFGSIDARDRDPLRFLDSIWESGRDYTSVGFKWTRGQNATVLQRVVTDPHVGKIVLHRRNRIKTLVSERIATQTNQWEVYRTGDLLADRPRIDLTVEELRRHIASNQAFYADLRASIADRDQTLLEVDYEDLFVRSVQTRLLQFAGVDNRGYELRAASIKQNSTDLRDLIANFDALESALHGTELEAELHDCGI